MTKKRKEKQKELRKHRLLIYLPSIEIRGKSQRQNNKGNIQKYSSILPYLRINKSSNYKKIAA